jgi:hypothetical protein
MTIKTNHFQDMVFVWFEDIKIPAREPIDSLRFTVENNLVVQTDHPISKWAVGKPIQAVKKWIEKVDLNNKKPTKAERDLFWLEEERKKERAAMEKKWADYPVER